MEDNVIHEKNMKILRHIQYTLHNPEASVNICFYCKEAPSSDACKNCMHNKQKERCTVNCDIRDKQSYNCCLTRGLLCNINPTFDVTEL